MIRKIILIIALLGLTACAAPQIASEQDGGIGGTGAPMIEV